MTKRLTIILDVDGELSPDDLPRRSDEILGPALRLTDFGAPRLRRTGVDKTPVDWTALARAVVQLAAEARRRREVEGVVELLVAGLAPLPVFTLLGAELSAWAPAITVANRRKNGEWDLVSSQADGTAPEGEFFDLVTGYAAEPSDATGWVAVFVSCGQTVLRDRLHACIGDAGEALAGVVEIRTSEPRVVDTATAPAAAEELTRQASQIMSRFPRASGVYLFVAGPGSLALLTGRALNPNVIPETRIANYSPAGYEHALTFPWRRQRIAIDEAPEAADGRTRAMAEILAGIDELRSTIDERDVPSFVPSAHAHALVKNLADITIDPTPEGDEFRLSVLHRRMKLGRGLVDALRHAEPSMQRRIARALVLHELHHTDQNLLSTNFAGVGRAGVALEEVDYWADAVALATLTTWMVRTKAGVDEADVASAASDCIESALEGIRAFDRFEHGDRIDELPERRLRRYLLWHLQLARARTLRAPSDIAVLFSERLVVELAPADGYLDARHDKIIRRAHPEAELFIVLGGRLVRQGPFPSFRPAELVDAVRTYDGSAIEVAMDVVVHQHARMLVPWTGE